MVVFRFLVSSTLINGELEVGVEKKHSLILTLDQGQPNFYFTTTYFSYN